MMCLAAPERSRDVLDLHFTAISLLFFLLLGFRSEFNPRPVAENLSPYCLVVGGCAKWVIGN